MTEPTERKIIRADRTFRTVTLIGVALVVVIGIVALAYTMTFLDDIEALARRSPDEAAAKAGLVLKVVAVAGAGVSFAAGAYLAGVALLTWRSGEFPPPGTRVLRDTTVTSGPASRRWAWFAFLVAVTLLLGAIVVLLLTWHVAEGLFGS